MKRALISLVFFSFSEMLISQDILNQKVSVSFNNISLERALFDLIEKSDILLTYSNSIIPKDKVVNFKASNQRLEIVLNKILEGTQITYEVIGSQIVLKQRAETVLKSIMTLSGYVRDEFSGERIIGAVVYDEKQNAGAYTNELGFYSLSLASGEKRIIVSCLGYSSDTIFVNLNANLTINFSLKTAYLQQVEVRALSDSSALQTGRLSTIVLNVNQIQRMAGLGGETDVLRAAFQLPGVQTGADGFGGISVRGGNIDQNQFLLDGVNVFNASHGLGVFSIFNGSAIRNAHFIKGNFPAKYGGRISSVWDIQTKDGNSIQHEGEVDLGLSTGKVSLEGPIRRGAGSFFASARRAFFDVFSVPVSKVLREEKGIDGYIDYHFYDFNGKINHQLSKKDRIYLSYYRGFDDFKDKYKLARIFKDTLVEILDNDHVRWGNTVGAFRWSHQLSDNMISQLGLSYSKNHFTSQDYIELGIKKRTASLQRETLLVDYNSDIEEISLKADFDFYTTSGHSLEFGAVISHQIIQPGVVFFNQSSSLDDTTSLDTTGQVDKRPIKANELDLYWQDEVFVSRKLLLNYGLRLSALSGTGRFYLSPQPRLLMTYLAGSKTILSVSFGRHSQNLHQLSPTSIGLAKDLWVTSSKTVKPQSSWQLTGGINQKLGKNYELILEGYLKTLQDIILFKGAVLEEVNAVNWQDKISKGQGESYGLELLVKRNHEKVSGWLSYSIARTDRRFDKEINRGRSFPYRLDRLHNLSLQVQAQLNRKWIFALGFQVAQGNAFTFPVQEYDLVQVPGQPPSDIIPKPRVIDELNNERFPVYHRLDASFSYQYVKKTRVHTWFFGAYNAYNRKNPLYITVRDRFNSTGEIQKEAVKVSLLPFFPTLRYSIFFR